LGYVAVKGGREAIEGSEKFLTYQRIKGESDPIQIEQIKEQMYSAVDRVMSEGSLYAPDLAALALKQAAGDTFEASFILRAYRTTKSRIDYSKPVSSGSMKIIRRISAAFKDIPGGQILGPSSDYILKLLDFELIDDSPEKRDNILKKIFKDHDIRKVDYAQFENFPKVIDLLRKEGLLIEKRENVDQDQPCDITRIAPSFPATRSASLQTMARGETGGMLMLAYSNMRGYGDIHPTIGELRIGFLPVQIEHPLTGKPFIIGEVKVTEAEVIARFDDNEGVPKFTLGYGLCFGHNELKAISMAVLDRAMNVTDPQHISEDEEFVLSHIDGIESMGFATHYKLPHYVTFQSDLDRLRKAKREAKK
jgi:alpha-D-ribose 1-methylphosphonate 5-triphosphate synthase subunit PhnI